MIITKVVMYVKFMHNGLLEWPSTPHTTFGTFWEMGNWFNGAIASD
jgi:hypothetical protein